MTRLARRARGLADLLRAAADPCRLLGHAAGATESGSNVCPRCGAHEYHDAADYARRPLLRPPFAPIDLFRAARRRRRLGRPPAFRRCPDCGRLDRAFGRPAGAHDGCLPF